MLPFELSEYQDRVKRTLTAMEKRGIDTLLITNPANMCWLTGYDGWSFYVHQMVILSPKLEQPVWVGRLMDANAARVTTYLKAENIYGYPDKYVQSTERHPMDYVADLLKEKGFDKGRVGVEMDVYYFTAACYTTLVKDLPDADLVDATGLVNWQKIIKTPAEIAYERQAAQIVDAMMTAGIDAIEPGVRQCDAVAEIYKVMASGTPEFGGEYSCIVPMLPTGEGTSTPHLTWTDAPFKTGEATILELAGVRMRYNCPMARTVHLGKPPQKLADTEKVVVEGLNNAIEAAKPGATAEEVEGVWRETIARHGIEKESRIGYSTGLNYPPDWGEATLSLRPGDKTVLQENMVIHIIPGIWMDDWGLEISDCILVTPNGGEAFCKYPRKLVVKD
jgi:ectoine hydrolase